MNALARLAKSPEVFVQSRRVVPAYAKHVVLCVQFVNTHAHTHIDSGRTPTPCDSVNMC